MLYPTAYIGVAREEICYILLPTLVWQGKRYVISNCLHWCGKGRDMLYPTAYIGVAREEICYILHTIKGKKANRIAQI